MKPQGSASITHYVLEWKSEENRDERFESRRIEKNVKNSNWCTRTILHLIPGTYYKVKVTAYYNEMRGNTATLRISTGNII